LPILLTAGSFDFIKHQGDGKDEIIIHAQQFLDKFSSNVRQQQIKYGYDVITVSTVTIVKKIISSEYLPGTSFDPLSIDLLTYPSRGPPSLNTLS